MYFFALQVRQLAKHHEELAQLTNAHQLELEATHQQWQTKMSSGRYSEDYIALCFAG